MKIDPEKLVIERLARAMSQEEAAIACELSARTIQRIEAGQAASLESTKALITIFGVGIISDPVAQFEGNEQSAGRVVLNRLGLASRTSARWGFDGARSMFAMLFVIVAFAKLVVPSQTGLFVNEGFGGLGVLAAPPVGSVEVLDYWIIPIMLVAAAAFLFSIGKVRRLVLR